ncbi:MAG: hypothetical protein KAT26_02140 [Marinosulfonomonas sp.]|nr:hypothetical protein [Marinosulfonomonas sp.]
MGGLPSEENIRIVLDGLRGQTSIDDKQVEAGEHPVTPAFTPYIRA